ncbi:Hexuronate transporter [Caulifigura coniformis]|uniref:Hexuronate transporter n=1 Tax=Caulifigura coniformis TaxID=2527983 RepID=A0A517SID0_9PLAN|nr:MFS transporter [Caulifigura coniformis]QDT55881.1 Hexuronate transporter [Caulifigura coniformis]
MLVQNNVNAPTSTQVAVQPQAPEPARMPIGSWPWKVAVFLMAATALSYMDRQALSVVGPIIKQELSLSNTDLGQLLAAFFWTYGLMHIGVGLILDRTNIRFTYPLFVALWSISQIGAGLATGYASLYVARLFLGTFEAAGQTGAARIIARVMPPEHRAFANGLMMSGGSLGAMLAPLLMITLADSFGWRIGFAVFGGLGLVWATLWLAWFRPNVHVTSVSANPEPWSDILRDRRFWGCVGGAICTIPLLHILGSWIPTYLRDGWNIPTADQRLPLLLLAIGLDVGFVGGGAAVSILVKRGRSAPKARLLVMTAATLMMAAAAAVPRAPNLVTALVLLGLVHIGRATWGAIFLAFNQDVAPGRVATVAGTMGALGACGGAGLITLIGAVADRTGGFSSAFYIAAALAVLGQGFMLVSFGTSKTAPKDSR